MFSCLHWLIADYFLTVLKDAAAAHMTVWQGYRTATVAVSTTQLAKARLDLVSELLGVYDADPVARKWCEDYVQSMIQSSMKNLSPQTIPEIMNLIRICHIRFSKFVLQILTNLEQKPYTSRYITENILPFAGALHAYLKSIKLSFASPPYNTFTKQILFAAMQLWMIAPPSAPMQRVLPTTGIADPEITAFLEAPYQHTLVIRAVQTHRTAIERQLRSLIGSRKITATTQRSGSPHLLIISKVYSPPTPDRGWSQLGKDAENKLHAMLRSCGHAGCKDCESIRTCLQWTVNRNSLKPLIEAFGKEVVRTIFSKSDGV